MPHAELRQEGDVLQREVLGAALGPLGDHVEGLEQAWSRRWWFDSDGLSRSAANGRRVHLHAPRLLAVHPLLDSLIELLKLYKTVQK